MPLRSPRLLVRTSRTSRTARTKTFETEADSPLKSLVSLQSFMSWLGFSAAASLALLLPQPLHQRPQRTLRLGAEPLLHQPGALGLVRREQRDEVGAGQAAGDRHRLRRQGEEGVALLDGPRHDPLEGRQLVDEADAPGLVPEHELGRDAQT